MACSIPDTLSLQPKLRTQARKKAFEIMFSRLKGLSKRLLIISIIINLLAMVVGAVYFNKTRWFAYALYENYVKKKSFSPMLYHRQRVEAFKLIEEDMDGKNVIIFAGSSLIMAFPWAIYFREMTQDTIIVNRGIGGDTTEGLLRRYEPTFFQLGRPEKIFLMVGTNDINGNVYMKGHLQIEDIIEKYSTLLEKLSTKLPAESICVQSLLPVRGNWAPANPLIRRFNETLEADVRTKGFCYIDLYDEFVDETGQLKSEYSLDDGIHLTTQGYRVWLNILAPYVTRKPRNIRDHVGE